MSNYDNECDMWTDIVRNDQPEPPAFNTFRVILDLGNDAMQTPQDVADALRAIAYRTAEYGLDNDMHTVRDINGNRAGRYYTTKEQTP